MLMRKDRIVWLPTELFDQCATDADHFYDLETGGALMGYWHGTDAAVITAIIEAGPGALHEQYNFEPDQQWQLERIAQHYAASGRRETYIGDWHTHPTAKTGRLSRTDLGVLRRIIATPAARASTPIMIVLHGRKGAWQATAWVAALKGRRIFWPKLLLSKAALRLHKPARGEGECETR
jgi:integrative and conjugative element protein (TIGR02256 family)